MSFRIADGCVTRAAMSIRAAGSLIAAIVFVACGGGGTPPAENPPAAATDAPAVEPQPAPTGEQNAAASKEDAPKEEAAPERAPKIDKPPSESTIGGKSISLIDGVGLQEAVTKLGWKKEGNDGPAEGKTVGSYETLRYEVGKGKLAGVIEVIRPALVPGDVSTTMAPPLEQKDSKGKEGAAVYYDEASDVLVAVMMTEGKPTDAKGILGKLVKKAPVKKK
jgi:hypothetical protein